MLPAPVSHAIVKRAFESGEPVPLEVMLYNMRYFLKKAERQSTEEDVEAALKEAGMWAQASASYMHPRLQAIMAKTTLESGDTLTALLKAIDGSTTGIAAGDEVEESSLEAKPPLHMQH
jgi:hypothetical protein